MKQNIEYTFDPITRKVHVVGDVLNSAIMECSLEYAFVPDMQAEEEREYFGIPTLSKEAHRICSDATYAEKQRKKPQSFIGKYEFLSNMYLCTVIIGDMAFPSAENAYQAMKCKTRKEMEEFQYITPYEAKKRGAEVDLRSNWKEIKDKVMKKVLQAKFEDQELAVELLHTDNMLLCEKNYWGDTEWGKCYVEKHEDIYFDEEYVCSRSWHEWQGENKLGKLLCEVRQEIKDSHVYDPYLIGYAEQADVDVDWIGRK